MVLDPSPSPFFIRSLDLKVIYEFNTESENYDGHELELVHRASDMVVVIDKIREQVRQWYKYDPRDAIPVEEIQDKIYDIINDHIDIAKLVF